MASKGLRVAPEGHPILRVVADADESMGPTEVADILDQPVNTIKQRMYQMSKDGELRVVSRGRYVIGSHNLHNLHNQNDQKVTEVTEVMSPHNQDRWRSLSADEANERVEQLKSQGMREDYAVAEVMKRMQRED
jgi:hypothetical protein